MKVLKFGGTSVANAQNIEKVVAILKGEVEKGRVITVVSAFAGVTDTLERVGELANQKNIEYLERYQDIANHHNKVARDLGLNGTVIDTLQYKLGELKSILEGIYLINEFSAKTRDKVLGFGELLSSFIISESLKLKVPNTQLKDSRDLIITDANFIERQLLLEQTEKNIKSFFSSNSLKLTVMPGFIARSETGDATTLGRGGSDFTASIIGAALDVDVLEIWTDVSGMYTANPKIVKQAFPINELSYQEAMELSHFGAKVLYPPTIRPVLEKGIPIKIKNTFAPDEVGTLVHKERTANVDPVKGISHLSNIALLTLEGNGMVGVPGISKRLFEALSLQKINIILITQASSEHSICVAVKEEDAIVAKETVDVAFAYEITLGKIDPIIIEEQLAIIAVIGDGMKNHQGVSGKMFSSLGKNNVNIRAIAQGASERNISAVISSKDVKKAVNTLHYRFFERQVKTLNLFVVGVGNVGARLLSQIKQQQEHLNENLFLNVRVAGMSNSRKMIFNKEGIDLSSWQETLENGIVREGDNWFNTIKELNLQNSIFIDVTANEEVAYSYNRYLKESISIVACNKIACSSQFDEYQELKRLSRKFNAPFLFETNVGAGLPIINSLNNLINSGDRITSIKAVLSGSLNFIFNNFNEETSFHDVVKQAGDDGYTEPDPRIDLSGVDVARKILILARESGYEMDMEDIENVSFLPTDSIKASTILEFFKSLKTESVHFNNLYQNAKRKDCQLKYVAEFNNGKAKVSLQEIEKNDPFYNLQGKDNIVLFYTERYADQPLIIKGAGAGAEVTASGLFGDIIRLGNK